MTRFLLLLTLLFLTGIPGVHKLLGDYPPEWFVGLFKDSVIGAIPGGLYLSFWIIVLLELCAGILFFIALLQKEFTGDVTYTYSTYGLYLTQILFVVLFFGSFLIENYDNGFKDFVYLLGVVGVQRWWFTDR